METLVLGLLGFGAYALWVFTDTLDKRPRYKSTEEKFDAKIQGFGWDEPSKQTEVVKKQVKQVNQSELLVENESLLSFLDKHFDLFSIDSELYTLNLNQIKNEQHVSINHRLRNILEHKGLYDFEIDSHIINGSDAVRMHMADGIR
jgi:hypothetical protein